ncbi:multiple C2 domain and transmembrane region protein 16 [Lolium perenne]|uniref:multiple C2 domain and transmembrane region protein 16 n=1 Tax=Lolium perenne TaxID=4522 RepID=UPI0021EA114D|nr:FT-interacting protein 7-like [Lolium perenne]
MATVRKLVVEVVEARNLLPKDGTGTSSPYARADFDGQRRKTRTVPRDLNPAWNEPLEFNFPGPGSGGVDPVAGEPLEIAVFHDVRVGPSRRNNFLGRVRLDARQFVRKGEEALIYFPLEKKNFFSWVRGDIGLKVYYLDEPLVPPEPEPTANDPPAADAEAAKDVPAPADPPPVQTEEPSPPAEVPAAEAAQGAPQGAGDEASTEKPPEAGTTAPTPATEDAPVMSSEAVPAADGAASESPPEEEAPAPPPIPTPMPRQVPVPPRAAPPPPDVPMERSKHDLVDKMPFLFVRVVRARGLPARAQPHVRVAAGGRHACTREARRGAFFEWDQTFAFARDPSIDSPGPTLEVSVWDLPPDADVSVADDRSFLGGLCFDTADVHARDPPDGPLATQWYRLEGGRRLAGADLMVATWAGTQADEAFAEAWKADSPASSSSSAAAASRAKVYVSPKLWLLRMTVIEAQDTLTAAPPRDAGIKVRGTLGFQTLKTRTTVVTRNGGPAWNEDLVFVAAEPFIDDDCFVISLEVRHGKEAFPVGSASISLASIERRVDDRKVASKWLDLLPSDEAMRKVGKRTAMHMHGGRLHVRVCLDGGYHVADEPPYASSDFRPSARQLWRPPVGVLELGIVGCKGLLPMRTAEGKGCTDAYAVAKYGPKWARTRTISDSFDPAWNEQYTWPVYDPCTVLTVGVFDDPLPSLPPDGGKDGACSRPMGKVRMRLSTLENGRVYRGMYPLILMLPTGAKKMGDVELAVRFATSGTALDVLHMYGQPSLPAMHHLQPIPAMSRETLRLAAARISSAHLARAEPPLRREVSMWMLDAAEPRGFSMRKLRANWNRAVAALSWVADAARWAEDTRSWRNPTATMMAHAVLVLLAWHPDLVVPTLTLHVAAVGVWKYRRRPRAPAPHPCVRASMAETPDREELDEEFDTIPSARPPEVVRARYDRARMVGARLQAMVGDVATQAERLQALVSWRDPRATGMFVVLCVVVAIVLYMVPMKVVAVVAGFYYLRHPMFRDRMPAPVINFFRRLPSMSERIM